MRTLYCSIPDKFMEYVEQKTREKNISEAEYICSLIEADLKPVNPDASLSQEISIPRNPLNSQNNNVLTEWQPPKLSLTDSNEILDSDAIDGTFMVHIKSIKVSRNKMIGGEETTCTFVFNLHSEGWKHNGKTLKHDMHFGDNAEWTKRNKARVVSMFKAANLTPPESLSEDQIFPLVGRTIKLKFESVEKEDGSYRKYFEVL